MALTLSENFRWTAGGRAFRMYSITHDEATSTVYAVSMDLDYIEGFIDGGTHYTSAPGALSYCACTLAADHKSITLSIPAKASSVTQLLVMGW